MVAVVVDQEMVQTVTPLLEVAVVAVVVQPLNELTQHHSLQLKQLPSVVVVVVELAEEVTEAWEVIHHLERMRLVAVAPAETGCHQQGITERRGVVAVARRAETLILAVAAVAAVMVILEGQLHLIVLRAALAEALIGGVVRQELVAPTPVLQGFLRMYMVGVEAVVLR